MSFVLITFGCAAIIGALFGKEFYAADVETCAPFKEKSSRWSGRLVYLIVGIGLLAIGIKLLF